MSLPSTVVRIGGREKKGNSWAVVVFSVLAGGHCKEEKRFPSILLLLLLFFAPPNVGRRRGRRREAPGNWRISTGLFLSVRGRVLKYPYFEAWKERPKKTLFNPISFAFTCISPHLHSERRRLFCTFLTSEEIESKFRLFNAPKDACLAFLPLLSADFALGQNVPQIMRIDRLVHQKKRRGKG